MEEIEIDVFALSITEQLAFDELAWGCSSVGRAVALQAIGQEFDSPQLHQPNLNELWLEQRGRVAQLVRACA